jgi:hypothetical protein
VVAKSDQDGREITMVLVISATGHTQGPFGDLAIWIAAAIVVLAFTVFRIVRQRRGR